MITDDKRVLGGHLVRTFEERGYAQIYIADRSDDDLIILEDVKHMDAELHPEIVIYLASKVGSIGYHQENPAALFYENLMMGAQLLHTDSRAECSIPPKL